MVLFAQAFSGWLSIALEYGFTFSATREIARSRDHPESSAGIIAGVLGANTILLGFATFGAVIVLFTVPEFRRNPVYLWLALLIAATQGVRPLWYFQGIEEMRFPAALNVAARVIVTAGIFLWVKTADSGWKVLALQFGTGALISAVILIAMYRRVPFRWPTVRLTMAALRMGWTMFLSRSAISLYTLANSFVLGVFTNVTAVSYYGTAERLNRAALGLLQPVSQALYPRMSHLALKDPDRAAQAARLGLVVFAGFGALAGAACVVLAPWMIRILLGASYLPTINVFRVMSLMLPLIAVSNILGTQWMLPFGMDRVFIKIILAAGALNLGLAVYLAPHFGAIGMAWSVVAAEMFVTLTMWIVLSRSRRKFWISDQRI
jgi:PST family polysaccharide transporter